MGGTVVTVVAVSRRIVATIREEHVPFKAASVAYYALASLLPLLVLTLALLSTVGGADALTALLRSQLTATQRDAFEAVLSNTRGRRLAGALGIAFTVWSASKVFRGLTIAFEGVYDAETDLPLLGRIAKSLFVLVLLLVVAALLTSASVLLGLERFSIGHPVVVGNLVATLFVGVALFPLYYVLPPISTSFEHALPGTVVAAVGLVGLQLGFFFYVRLGEAPTAYSVLNAVLLFVTLLYLATNLFLVGAVVNAALDW